MNDKSDKFDFNEYISMRTEGSESGRGCADAHGSQPYDAFYALCEKIKAAFFEEWQSRENSRATLEIQKRAIIGYEKEKNFFLDRIKQLLSEYDGADVAFPHWYKNAADAVYHENWGMAGLAEWFDELHTQSSSAKVIGENIFFMENGTMKKKEQTISPGRKDQLIKSFMLLTPTERMDKSYHEVYLLDGTRITVFTEPMSKQGQSSIIFRRYVIPQLSFEEQAKRGTVPFDAIPLLTSMVRIGYNVVFMGAVRTAKTTFLATWQTYEDPGLEGVMVETDPEIPMNRLLPGAPIIQLIADGDELRKISKSLLRSDADYFILAEARDGIALDTAVRIAAKGTKRMKMTFHSRMPEHFVMEAATEIVKSTGGNMDMTMKMIAGGFDFLFHFVQLKEKNKKRLKGIYQLYLDDNGMPCTQQICSYEPADDSWLFSGELHRDKREYGCESDAASFAEFERELERLSQSGRIKND